MSLALRIIVCQFSIKWSFGRNSQTKISTFIVAKKKLIIDHIVDTSGTIWSYVLTYGTSKCVWDIKENKISPSWRSIVLNLIGLSHSIPCQKVVRWSIFDRHLIHKRTKTLHLEIVIDIGWRVGLDPYSIDFESYFVKRLLKYAESTFDGEESSNYEIFPFNIRQIVSLH